MNYIEFHQALTRSTWKENGFLKIADESKNALVPEEYHLEVDDEGLSCHELYCHLAWDDLEGLCDRDEFETWQYGTLTMFRLHDKTYSIRFYKRISLDELI